MRNPTEGEAMQIRKIAIVGSVASMSFAVVPVAESMAGRGPGWNHRRAAERDPVDRGRAAAGD